MHAYHFLDAWIMLLYSKAVKPVTEIGFYKDRV